MVSGSCTTMLRGRVSWTPEMALPELTFHAAMVLYHRPTGPRTWSLLDVSFLALVASCIQCPPPLPWAQGLTCACATTLASAPSPPFGRIRACATVPADGAMPYLYGMPSFAPSSPESPSTSTGDFGTGVAAALDTYRTTVDAGRTSKPAPSNFVNAPHFAARAKPAGAAGSFGTAAGVGVVGVGVVEAGALHAPQPPLRRPELEHTHLAAAWALDE